MNELPGTEAAYLGECPVAVTQFEQAWVGALQADLDSARDRFIRMEGRHEAKARKVRALRRQLGELGGTIARLAAENAELKHALAWDEGGLAELQELLAEANAERERLAAINAQMSDDIADLKHALASAATPLESRLRTFSELSGEFVKLTPDAIPRMWFTDDPEPEYVERVRDSEGDVWTRNLYGVWTALGLPAAWWYIAKRWGPLTEVIGGTS